MEKRKTCSINQVKKIIMNQDFLEAVNEFGNIAHSDLSHGNGVEDEINAKDCIEFYSKQISNIEIKFLELKTNLENKFPNIKSQ